MSVQEPLLVRGGLTGRIFVVTSYMRHSDGRFVASRKFDVTDQFNALLQDESNGEPSNDEETK